MSTLITDRSKSGVWATVGSLAFVWWNTSLSPPVTRKRSSKTDLDFVIAQVREIRHQTKFAVMGLGEVCTEDLAAIVAGLDDPHIGYHDATNHSGRLKFDTAVIYDRSKVALGQVSSAVDKYAGRSLKIGEVAEFISTLTEDAFKVVVSHWPSRLTLAEASPARFELGSGLRWLVDRMQGESRSFVVLMGDYNDDPFSPSLADHLIATRDRSLARKKGLLYNPFWKWIGESHHLQDEAEQLGICGTHFYPDGNVSRWFTYDQMIFSSEFLQDRSMVLDEASSGVLALADLRAKVLNRREIFDHLPVLGTVELRSKV
ncbi:endonuclease/exonuclease/phosphatase family protein [Burkholderia multivorans]|uniref:endonuclease/exonuclease/phosphatase family protein n=1 Tax=Burkholderia multivorans TaxID=87883 RepID=UPI0030B98D0D